MVVAESCSHLMMQLQMTKLVVALATTLLAVAVVVNMATVLVPFSLTCFASAHHHHHCLHNYVYKIIDTPKLSNDTPDTTHQNFLSQLPQYLTDFDRN